MTSSIATVPADPQGATKILVLGATGATGRLIVNQAVARGYDVTVLVRSAEKARDITGAKLIVGDARDETALRAALKGREAVVSALGTPVSPFREVTLLSTATRALVSAMKAEQVSRLVCITGMGAGDSAGHGGFIADNVIFPLLLKKVVRRQGPAGSNRQRQRAGLGPGSPLDPEQQARPRLGPGPDGFFGLPWRYHRARRRCDIRARSGARRYLAASVSADHVVMLCVATPGSARVQHR